MTWYGPIDPYDADTADDVYFDGEELDEDLLYSLFDESEYEVEVFSDEEEK